MTKGLTLGVLPLRVKMSKNTGKRALNGATGYLDLEDRVAALRYIQKLEQGRDNLTAYLMGMARKYEEGGRPGTASMIRHDIKQMRMGKPQ